MTVRCLVIGVGKMGLAHLQAIAALEPEALAGWAPSDRRRESVESTGAALLGGSLEEALQTFYPTHVVVASPVETLAQTAMCLMASGVKQILLEKPGALTSAEGRELTAVAENCGAKIYIGYNRRFYTSIRTALAMITASGERIESILFEFNEVVANPEGPANHAPEVKERWLLANSLHVIDSALFPVGLPDPTKSNFLRAGALSWHASGKIFTGAGETGSGVPFAYHANWGAPGRWGFEWMTPSVRYIFRPLEQLSVMRRGSFSVEVLALADEFDKQFKPGVYLQDRAFLSGDVGAGLVPLAEGLLLIPLGASIAGYPNDVC